MWPFHRPRQTVTFRVGRIEIDSIVIPLKPDQEALLRDLRASEVDLEIVLPPDTEQVIKDAAAAHLLSRMLG